jgi:heme-degrading monooxygenase HmoA
MPGNRDNWPVERPDSEDVWQDIHACHTGTRPPHTADSDREGGVPWRNGRVCYVSTLHVRINSGTANQVERLFTEHILSVWRGFQARGELLSLTLVRSEAVEDQYDLVTQWASKDAHDRNTDAFVAQVYALALACYIAARPKAGATGQAPVVAV